MPLGTSTKRKCFAGNRGGRSGEQRILQASYLFDRVCCMPLCIVAAVQALEQSWTDDGPAGGPKP